MLQLAGILNNAVKAINEILMAVRKLAGMLILHCSIMNVSYSISWVYFSPKFSSLLPFIYAPQIKPPSLYLFHHISCLRSHPSLDSHPWIQPAVNTAVVQGIMSFSQSISGNYWWSNKGMIPCWLSTSKCSQPCWTGRWHPLEPRTLQWWMSTWVSGFFMLSKWIN